VTFKDEGMSFIKYNLLFFVLFTAIISCMSLVSGGSSMITVENVLFYALFSFFVCSVIWLYANMTDVSNKIFKKRKVYRRAV
tara:strand:- start:1640 stop:1885 length:246 start_codon:yes stop_codon:yes gene_type:complete